MAFRKLAADEEAQPGSGNAVKLGFIGSVESLEDPLPFGL